MIESERQAAPQNAEPSFVEGVDYYIEGSMMVLTARFLMTRGYCCGKGCRHCPYSIDEWEAALKKKVV